MTEKLKTIYLYSRYERLWHWLQMALILVLLLTGFEVHGEYSLFGFHRAVTVHNFLGLTWLIAFAFFFFWIFTTGEWKQYIPTTRKLFAVIKYYGYGIFRGQPHPVPKRKEAKHNPLQRLTYLGVAAVLLPLQMLTGLLYWSYNSWAGWGLDFISLAMVSFVHTVLAFAILTFVIVHVYMTTTGHTPFAHIKAMLTGWEDVDERAKVEDWEKAPRFRAPKTPL